MHRTSKIVPLNPTLFLPSYLYYKWRLSQSLSPASAIARGRFASHCYCCCFVPIFQLFSGHWHVRKWLCICGTKCFWCRGGLGSESESPFRMLPVVFSPRSGVLNPYQVIALDIRWFSFPKRWTGHKQYGGSIDEVGHWGLCNMLKWWWGQLEFCWLIYWWMLMNVDDNLWKKVNEPNLAFCARLLRIYPQEASDTLFKHQSHHISPFWLALKQSVLTASRNPQRCSGRRQRQSWRVMLQRS